MSTNKILENITMNNKEKCDLNCKYQNESHSQTSYKSYSEIVNYFTIYYNQIPEEFFEKIIFSLECFNKFFENDKMKSNEKLTISFNGGKDCLAAYILIKYFFYCKKYDYDYTSVNSFTSFCKMNGNKANTSEDKSYNTDNITFIYFANDDNFTEEEDYVNEFTLKEKINTFYLYSDLICGLKFMINNYETKLIIMGTRKDDLINHYKMTIDEKLENSLVHPSTSPYPNFIRFYPVFDFDFEDIWRLILLTNYSYLKLYNKGYSSIGKKHNTFINDNLKFDDLNILPAWCLKEFISERNYRK
jgi:3'-phosphoadenosine 5'-phosphosulfate sulfotransferase (PAPS reductase)/FAD synthetase